jgi:O-antigen/teichoic acid export membrane protein
VVLIINKFVKNFSSVGISNILSQLLLFLLGAYYARILGKEYFGNISVVQQVMIYFTMIVLAGLQTFGMREVAKGTDNIANIVGDILSLRLVLAALCYILILCTAVFIRKDYVFASLLALYGITVIPTALNLDWVYIGLQEMQHNAVYVIIKSTILFLLVFLFVSKPENVFMIPIFTMIGTGAASVYHYYVYFFKKKLRVRIDFNPSKGIQYFKAGLPFLFSGILAMINCNVDSIIIAFTRSKAEAGLYSSAYYVVLFLMSIVALIFTPVFPVLIRLFNDKNLVKLSFITDKLSKVIILLVVPIVLGGIILSKEIILFLFGNDYLDSHIAFKILMIYIFLLFVREIYGYTLNACNREKQYLKIVGISSGINLILNVILIPQYGINVAAVTTVISEFLNLYLMKKNLRGIIDVSYLKYIFKAIPSAAVMSGAVLAMNYLNLNIIVIILSAALLYGISILGFKYMSISEIKGFVIKNNF